MEGCPACTAACGLHRHRDHVPATHPFPLASSAGSGQSEGASYKAAGALTFAAAAAVAGSQWQEAQADASVVRLRAAAFPAGALRLWLRRSSHPCQPAADWYLALVVPHTR
jgi:hypothetical protein